MAVSLRSPAKAGIELKTDEQKDWVAETRIHMIPEVSGNDALLAACPTVCYRQATTTTFNFCRHQMS